VIKSMIALLILLFLAQEAVAVLLLLLRLAMLPKEKHANREAHVIVE